MPTPYTRRRALQLAGFGLATAAAGAAGLAWTSTRQQTFTATADIPSAGPAEPLVEPAVLQSTAGVLEVTLTAAAGTGRVAGRTATTLQYNGALPGPTLRCRPDDLLRVTLVNGLAQPTNLHVHGLQVSPQGNGDNPSVMIEPGRSFTYEYPIPSDHPAGTFWYHPHHHGTVADQIFGGLFGAIVIDDPGPVPVTADRVLVISDLTLDADGAIAPVTPMQRRQGREGELVLVNGQQLPGLTSRPGARERWRLINACTARYLRLRLDGQHLQLLGVDLPAPAIAEVTDLLLLPGNRADLLVTMRTGASTLTAGPVNRGASMGSGMGSATTGRPSAGSTTALMSLTVAGPDGPGPPAIPPRPAVPDLRDRPPTRTRQITLAMGMGMGSGGAFTLDGRTFDPDRVDQTVAAGDVEDWTFVNTSTMDHPVHLHVWPMQLLNAGGADGPRGAWRDVVNVPAGGRTTVRIAFDRYTGRSVYHCHILDHEDMGMMGVVQVN